MTKYVHRLDLRLTEEQAEALRELAEEIDRSMASTVRLLVVAEIKRYQERYERERSQS